MRKHIGVGKYFLWLSGEHEALAVAEAAALLGTLTPVASSKHRLYACDSLRHVEKLAFAHEAYTPVNLSKLSGSYKVEFSGISVSERKRYLKHIWDSIPSPRVVMHNPMHHLVVLSIADEVVIIERIWKNAGDFLSRRSHLRTDSQPISLHPRLARCLVNLSGCRHGTILDPFTGTSGILIEALLTGRKAVGYDISTKMLAISEKNLAGMGSYLLQERDFFSLQKRVPYIVTDVPYGKNTTKIDSDFYQKVVLKLEKIVGKCAIVCFPHTVPEHIFSCSLHVQMFTYYIHASLSKRICVFQR